MGINTVFAEAIGRLIQEPVAPLGMARTHDPDTSKAAAANVNVPQREQDVLDALATLGGDGGDEQIADLLAEVYRRDEIPSNISPRIRPLTRKGLVEQADRKHKSRQGQTCRVSKLTALGWEHARAFSAVSDAK